MRRSPAAAAAAAAREQGDQHYAFAAYEWEIALEQSRMAPRTVTVSGFVAMRLPEVCDGGECFVGVAFAGPAARRMRKATVGVVASERLLHAPGAVTFARRLAPGESNTLVRHRFRATAGRPDGGQQDGVVARLRDGRAPHGRRQGGLTAHRERLR
jgi:hypothetical protein